MLSSSFVLRDLEGNGGINSTCSIWSDSRVDVDVEELRLSCWLRSEGDDSLLQIFFCLKRATCLAILSSWVSVEDDTTIPVEAVEAAVAAVAAAAAAAAFLLEINKSIL